MTLALATVVTGGATAEGAVSDADVILINAEIYTVDPEQPWVDALAIAGDRVLAIGSRRQVMTSRGPDTQVIDLKGAFVTAGFNDAHVHMDATGSLLTGVNLLDVHDAAGFVERLEAATRRLPPGSWIVRGDWGAYEQWGQGSAGKPAAADDQTGGADGSDPDGDPGGDAVTTQVDGGGPEASATGGEAQAGVDDAVQPGDAEAPAPPEVPGPFTPHRDLIDPVTPEHPVLLSRFDRSMYLANSLALELAGITAETPDPADGEIGKDADGRLTGILRGSAAALVEEVIPPMPFEQRLVGVKAVLDEARQGGVTTIQDLSSAEQVMAYQYLKRRGELTARIMIRPQIYEVEHVAALGLSRGFGDRWLKIIGYKGWIDGIMGNSSAMFFAPYDNDPENRGQLRPPMLPEGEEGAAFSMGEDDHYTDFPPGQMEKYIEAWVPTGVPPHIHAIGDLGNRILLDIYERVLKRHDMVDSDHRWRVIHAQVLRDEDIPRFGELHLVAEVNPYHVADDMRWMEERIGHARSNGAYAFRKLKDAGAVIIFGSDSPGTNAARYYLSPAYGLYAAVSRQTLNGEPAGGWFPGQRLTIEEAIDAYTRAPAWASFEGDYKGTLTPGKLADIAVFDTNLVEVGREEPARLLDARVLYTIVGGRVVYRRDE